MTIPVEQKDEDVISIVFLNGANSFALALQIITLHLYNDNSSSLSRWTHAQFYMSLLDNDIVNCYLNISYYIHLKKLHNNI